MPSLFRDDEVTTAYPPVSPELCDILDLLAAAIAIAGPHQGGAATTIHAARGKIDALRRATPATITYNAEPRRQN